MNRTCDKSEDGKVANKNGKNLQERDFSIVFRIFANFKNALNDYHVNDV